jgi:hypothetical protein
MPPVTSHQYVHDAFNILAARRHRTLWRLLHGACVGIRNLQRREAFSVDTEASAFRLPGARASSLHSSACMSGLPLRKHGLALVFSFPANFLAGSRRCCAGPRIHGPIQMERLHRTTTPWICIGHRRRDGGSRHASLQVRLVAQRRQVNQHGRWRLAGLGAFTAQANPMKWFQATDDEGRLQTSSTS